jgi:hypothetical protein
MPFELMRLLSKLSQAYKCSKIRYSGTRTAVSLSSMTARKIKGDAHWPYHGSSLCVGQKNYLMNDKEKKLEIDERKRTKGLPFPGNEMLLPSSQLLLIPSIPSTRERNSPSDPPINSPPMNK